MRADTGALTAIARGGIEPLDGGEWSRVTIALEFEAHGMGKLLVPLVLMQARKQLGRCRSVKMAAASSVARRASASIVRSPPGSTRSSRIALSAR